MGSRYILGQLHGLAILFFINLYSPAALTATVEETAKIPVRGAFNAPVSIMVFSDFSCPYCAKAVATIAEIERLYPGKLTIVFKHFPLRKDEATILPHEASMSAANQGKFWQMHDLLFLHQGNHQRNALDEDAKALHLDMKRFKKDMNQHRYRNLIMKDIAEAHALRISATPTFYIDGYKLEGLQSLSALQQIIENRLRTMPSDKVENSSLQQFLQSAQGVKRPDNLNVIKP